MAFGKINSKAKSYVAMLEKIDSPVLVDKSSAPADYDFVPYVVVDEVYNDQQIKAVCRFLESRGMLRYAVLSALNYKIKKDDIKTTQKEGLIAFYIKNQSDFYRYIKPGSPVLTFGPALYSVTKESDIYPVHCEQIIFGKSNFWFSRDLSSHGNFIYPAESLDFLFNGYGKWIKPIDSYKTRLLEIQISTILSKGVRFMRYPKLIKHFIESEQEFNDVFYEPNKHRKGDIMAWDTETSSLDFMTNKLGCITVSFDGVEGYYIPWRYVDKKKLGEIMKNNIQLGANLKFDVKELWKEQKQETKVTGYIVVESDEGRRYRIMNDAKVPVIELGSKSSIETGRYKLGSELCETDDLDFNLIDKGVEGIELIA